MSEETRWPEALAAQMDVVQWIRATLPDHAITGEACVLGKNNCGFTARFQSASPCAERDVVFKTNTLPQYQLSGRLSACLSRLCPGDVPQLLAWRELPRRVDTLFQPFVGQEVTHVGSLEALCEMARTLARVQTQVASARDETAVLPRLPLKQVPSLLDLLVEDVRDRYQARFQTDGGALIERFGIPSDLLKQLAYFRPRLDEWAMELSSLGCPESIDHRDLLPHNAALQSDGHVLIYDWEQAVMGCPLFSLDVLLAFAQDWEQNFSDGLTLRSERETPGTVGLRDAYLASLPWRTRAVRERAFDLALCLSPIRAAWAEGALATQFRQEEWWAEDLAWWLMRALRRWERMTL